MKLLRNFAYLTRKKVVISLFINYKVYFGQNDDKKNHLPHYGHDGQDRIAERKVGSGRTTKTRSKFKTIFVKASESQKLRFFEGIWTQFECFASNHQLELNKMGIKYQNPLIFKSVSFFMDQTLQYETKCFQKFFVTWNSPGNINLFSQKQI